MTGSSLMWLILERGPSKSQLEEKRENISQNFSLKKYLLWNPLLDFAAKTDLYLTYFNLFIIFAYLLLSFPYAYSLMSTGVPRQSCRQWNPFPSKIKWLLAATSSPILGAMLTQFSSHLLSWTLRDTPLGFSKLNDAFLNVVRQITCFLEVVSFY